MDKQRLTQLATHEAGHAVAYYVMGRPIERAIVSDELGHSKVDPVSGTSGGYLQDAIAAAAGWAGEKRHYRMTLPPEEVSDEINTAWYNLGPSADYEQIDVYLEQKLTGLTVVDIEAAADALVAQMGRLVEAVATALAVEREIGQERLAEIGAGLGVDFGETSADFWRTEAQS